MTPNFLPFRLCLKVSATESCEAIFHALNFSLWLRSHAFLLLAENEKVAQTGERLQSHPRLRSKERCESRKYDVEEKDGCEGMNVAKAGKLSIHATP